MVNVLMCLSLFRHICLFIGGSAQIILIQTNWTVSQTQCIPSKGQRNNSETMVISWCILEVIFMTGNKTSRTWTVTGRNNWSVCLCVNTIYCCVMSHWLISSCCHVTGMCVLGRTLGVLSVTSQTTSTSSIPP